MAIVLTYSPSTGEAETGTPCSSLPRQPKLIGESQDSEWGVIPENSMPSYSLASTCSHTHACICIYTHVHLKHLSNFLRNKMRHDSETVAAEQGLTCVRPESARDR